MRAALLTRPREMTIVDDWPEPELTPAIGDRRAHGARDLRLRPRAVVRRRPPAEFPWIIGHEGIGHIVRVGAAVSERIAGTGRDRAELPCGRCAACRPVGPRPAPTASSSRSTSRAFSGNGSRCPRSSRGRHPRISHEDLVCTEPLAVARSAVRTGGLAKGDHCLMVGAGSQGLLVCQLAIALGAGSRSSSPIQGDSRWPSRSGRSRQSPTNRDTRRCSRPRGQKTASTARCASCSREARWSSSVSPTPISRSRSHRWSETRSG